MYRICKQFEFQAAHILSRHSGRCRFPHGHNYRVEVTLTAEELDENSMVCDFQALKSVVTECLDPMDHAMLLNSSDTKSCETFADNPRTVIFDNRDPSSEVMAREIFEHLKRRLQAGTVETSAGMRFNFNPAIRVEKVRVWETSTAWAEYQG
jgi:6-pyruvoyltetrahydropterin/6-carboxytetrahydropterin synthase